MRELQERDNIEIETEDLPEPYHRMAELIGLEATLMLAHEFGGRQLYFPQPARIVQEARDRRIRAEFNGYNIDDLSRKFEMSERSIRRVIENSPLSVSLKGL
jgi:Mor family transcriptional regulator